MEKKKEMGFIEKFAAAGKELEKAMVESNKEAMIMIASSEGNDERRVSASIEGKSVMLSALLADVRGAMRMRARNKKAIVERIR